MGLAIYPCKGTATFFVSSTASVSSNLLAHTFSQILKPFLSVLDIWNEQLSPKTLFFSKCLLSLINFLMYYFFSNWKLTTTCFTTHTTKPPINRQYKYNVIIGNTNISSLPNKLEQLKELVIKHIDGLVITATKLHVTFPTSQYLRKNFFLKYWEVGKVTWSFRSD